MGCQPPPCQPYGRGRRSCTVRSKLNKFEYVWGREGEFLHVEVQCIMGNDHMGPLVNRLTHTTDNITFSQLRWRAVKMPGLKPYSRDILLDFHEQDSFYKFSFCLFCMEHRCAGVCLSAAGLGTGVEDVTCLRSNSINRAILYYGI